MTGRHIYAFLGGNVQAQSTDLLVHPNTSAIVKTNSGPRDVQIAIVFCSGPVKLKTLRLSGFSRLDYANVIPQDGPRGLSIASCRTCPRLVSCEHNIDKGFGSISRRHRHC